MTRCTLCFFDHFAAIGAWYNGPASPVPMCTTRVTMDNVSSMDGTTVTILISENEDAGSWIWRHTAGATNIPAAVESCNPQATLVEAQVGFCYPATYSLNSSNNEVPDYTVAGSPMFINQGRRSSGYTPSTPMETARPSSGHPGVVIAAFCDGHAIPLKDEMDQTLFVRLCRPGSGVILNPRDL